MNVWSSVVLLGKDGCDIMNDGIEEEGVIFDYLYP